MQRRNTRQRAMILDAVRARCDHPTAEDIYLDVSRVDSKVSRATVYRNLRVLEQTHDITCVKTPGGDRFDLRCDAHCHVVCTSCGAVIDAAVPYDMQKDLEVAQQTGFEITSHSTLFEGLCPSCKAGLRSSA